MKGKIFNAQEVQAIIAGNKTIFREVIKPQPNSNIKPVKLDYLCKTWQWATKESRREYPYQVGQKIFCKESFVEHDNKILFKASHQKLTTHFLGSTKWKPAQHMKQEHSRLTLEITEIKVERLGEISEEDAVKEGIPLSNEFKDRYYTPENNYAVPKIAFKRWWNATHKKPEEKFEANPFVWVVDFKINK